MLDEVLKLPSPWKEDNIYGLIAYYRTYSRYIPELDRRECWLETCLRVTEYSFSLAPEDVVCLDEVRIFLINLYQMNFLVSGRTLWRGDKNNSDATANYNCSFVCIDKIIKYAEMTYLLMEGAGVGFSVERKYTDKLPRFCTDRAIEYRYIKPETMDELQRGGEDTILCSSSFVRPLTEITYEVLDKLPQLNHNNSITISIGDSRMGWATGVLAFLYFMQVHKCPGKIIVDFSNIRPEGFPLKTMGGTASGHKVLMQAFKKIAWIIWTTGGELQPINAMDIANCIAEAVVCGGVRRSAQIALGDSDDSRFITAKHNLYSSFVATKEMEEEMWERNPRSFRVDQYDPKYRWRKSRVLSNNSIMLYDTPTVAELDEILRISKEFGEPGFINVKEALRRFPDFKGVNPCAEILLADRGLCNLGEIVLPNALRNLALGDVIYCLTRHLIRITLPTLFTKEWTKVNHRHRLLGVSLCGLVDAIEDRLIPQSGSIDIYKFYRYINVRVWEVAIAYCAELGINIPHNCTTVKPGGTLPTLPGVSAGMHRGYAPFFNHRIRVGTSHPINNVLQKLGLEVDPEVGYSEEDTPRWVYTIPCKSATSTRQIDESAIDQLERYKVLMDDYCDQNVSCTISVDMENELTEVRDWIINNFNSFVGITIFPKFDPALSPTPMPLLPFETITEEQYVPISFTEEEFHSLLCNQDDHETEDDELETCEKGFCPIR